MQQFVFVQKVLRINDVLLPVVAIPLSAFVFPCSCTCIQCTFSFWKNHLSESVQTDLLISGNPQKWFQFSLPMLNIPKHRKSVYVSGLRMRGLWTGWIYKLKSNAAVEYWQHVYKIIRSNNNKRSDWCDWDQSVTALCCLPVPIALFSIELFSFFKDADTRCLLLTGRKAISC